MTARTRLRPELALQPFAKGGDAVRFGCAPAVLIDFPAISLALPRLLYGS
jgi:hypothetical protein